MLNTDDMENLFTPLKSALVAALCAVLAFFAPIANLIFAVFIIFLLNCIAGIIADVVTEKKPFKIQKFFHCLLETLVFYFIIMTVYVIGDKLLNMDGAIQCSTVIVYAILYFYSTNILRNCYKLFPDSKTLKFLFYVLSFEIIKQLPYMERFKEKEAEVTDELKNEDQSLEKKDEAPRQPLLSDTCRCDVCAYRPCKIPVGEFCPMYYGGEEESNNG